MGSAARSLLLFLAMAALLAVPLSMRTRSEVPAGEGEALIVITPHNEQIRREFGPAFEAWHRARYGEPVRVVFSVPGGTSEIRKMLAAQTEAALRAGVPVGGHADLVFGGGSYEHQVLARGVTVKVGDEPRHASISAPVDFDEAWLRETYGENRIGAAALYDERRHWFGLALSGFGIVYNHDVLGQLELAPPRLWGDLCHGGLRGWVALANPGQSGSVTTAFEAILQRCGWIEGWRILRRMAANARSISGSALKPPQDVSHGDAAAGVCIDFYGRFEAQAIEDAGGGARLGYVDPAGQTVIDPDPISMLRGAPHPELARRFIEFCLADEGQALWGFRRRGTDQGESLGPREFELRRMPIRRSMYERFSERLVDRVDPYEIAGPGEPGNASYRAFVAPLFAAMAMDSQLELRAAWDAIVNHPAFPAADPLVSAWSIDDQVLRRMLLLFDELPQVPGPDGAVFALADVAGLAPLRAGWLGGEWESADLWHRDDRPQEALRRRCAAFFRGQYRAIVDIAEGGP